MAGVLFWSGADYDGGMGRTLALYYVAIFGLLGLCCLVLWLYGPQIIQMRSALG